MKERIVRLLSEHERYQRIYIPWMGTFHSICAKILRKEGHHIGYNPSFTIYDTNDQLDIVKQVFARLNIDAKEVKPQAVLNFISTAKNELITPDDYAGFAQGYFQQIVAEVYPQYQSLLKANNAVDFDDLLMQTVRLMQAAPDVLEQYQKLFRFIMVDEYQDTNHAQYKLIQMLAEGHRNIACVGDDDQSIYAFRGATIRNILEFEKDYPNAVIVKLEQNYRSTQKILDASFQVVSKNKGRKDKKLWTDNKGGANIVLYNAENEFDEGRWVARKIKKQMQEGCSAEEIAVLYRTNAQSRALEEQFLREAVNYRVVGGIRFYERKEIKDILAYLRVLYNTKDDSSLKRIINTPKRGIGAKAINDLALVAENNQVSMVELLLHHDDILTSGNIMQFSGLLKHLYDQAQQVNVVELINEIISSSGYLKMLQDGTSENESRVENIKELISVAAKVGELEAAESIAEFLNEVSLFQDTEEANDDTERVTLMTVHAAKGLEFRYVFVVGMEEGLFPHSRVYMDPRELEEERRLAYVAITRAKQQLYFTYTESRTYFGKSQTNPISRFIEDIDPELMERVSFMMSDFAFGGYKSSFSKSAPREVDDSGWEEVEDASAAPVDKNLNGLQVGDKVKHDYFGIGTIQKLEDGRAVVSFGPIYGVKELVLEYAPVKKL
jgi:DNA helicase-2/ATP-dependent DNA helicase PcrA